MAIKAVVCDIEGTTSSIAFVHKVLFPLAAARLSAYLQAHGAEKEVAEQLDVLWKKISGDAHRKDKVAALDATLHDYIRRDVKDTTLKWVQGKIWKEAFEAGVVKGHVYDEVPQVLAAWKKQGIKIYIYSSGSIEAQQLMFRYSVFGDLSECLDGYFDTTTGPKREQTSYEKIAHAVSYPPHEILFLSDIVEELEAAAAARFQTCLLLRESATAPDTYTGARALDFHAVSTQFF